MRKLVGRVIDLNVRLSDRLEPKHVRESQAYNQFDLHGRLALVAGGDKRVLDIGAGKNFHFAEVIEGRDDVHLIGQDISAEEMDDNALLDEKIVGDACREMPVAANSIDVILSRATVEHLHDVPGFLQLSYEKLRPGGKLIVTFAGRWAFFAIINRSLPERLKLRLLEALVPGSSGRLGFPAFYDHATHQRFASAAARVGFVEEVGYVSFYGVGYFRFFTPFFLLTYVLDSLRSLIGHASLSSYNTFVLVKPGTVAEAAERFGQAAEKVSP